MVGVVGSSGGEDCGSGAVRGAERASITLVHMGWMESPGSRELLILACLESQVYQLGAWPACDCQRVTVPDRGLRSSCCEVTVDGATAARRSERGGSRP